MNKSKLKVKVGNEIVFFEQEEIMAIQANNIYCVFLLKDNKSLKVGLPLSSALNLLDRKLFYRIHRSCIINCERIEKIDLSASTVKILNISKAFPIARQQKKAFFAFLKER